MYKLISLILTISLSGSIGNVTASGENRPTGSRSASLGNASVAIADIWSAFNNQAGLALIRKGECGLSYENRYLMKELGYSALAIAYPLKSGTIGFSAGYSGFSSCNESRLGLSYAKSFGKFLAFGLQLNYNSVKLSEIYGNRSYLTFEVGMMLNVTQELTFGVHVYNPVSAKLADYNNERAPAIISLGISHALSDEIILLAEIEKSILDKATLNAGIEYSVADKIHLMAGISTGQSAFSFGAGYEIRDLFICISTSRHTILGYSPQVSISCKF